MLQVFIKISSFLLSFIYQMLLIQVIFYFFIIFIQNLPNFSSPMLHLIDFLLLQLYRNNIIILILFLVIFLFILLVYSPHLHFLFLFILVFILLIYSIIHIHMDFIIYFSLPSHILDHLHQNVQ